MANSAVMQRMPKNCTKKEVGNIWAFFRKKNIWAYLLLVPSFLILFILLFFPALRNAYLSFFNIGLIIPTSTYVELKNYVELLSDPLFWHALRTTVLFTFSAILLELVLGFALALLLDKEIRYRFLRPLSLIPYLTSSAVAALIWRLIWDSELGPINTTLRYFGIDAPAWIGNPKTALMCVIITEVWRNLPFVSVILLAGLQSLPQSPYEAAKVDGATPWQTFLHVTLPLLKPVILIVLLFQTVFTFRAFDIIWIITEGGPGSSTTVLAILIYKTIFRFWRAGYGACISVVVLIFTLMVSLIFIAILFKEFEETAT